MARRTLGHSTQSKIPKVKGSTAEKKQFATRINVDGESPTFDATEDQELGQASSESLTQNVTEPANKTQSSTEESPAPSNGAVPGDGASNRNSADMLKSPVIKFDVEGHAVLQDGTLVVEPVPVDPVAETVSKPAGHDRELKTPSLVDLTDVRCTVCALKLQPLLSPLAVHPVLKVIACKRCAKFYNRQEFLTDKFGKDENCRWCGDGGDLVCCDQCSNAFCKRCIKRNLGRSFLHNLESMSDDEIWKCFVCDPKPIEVLQQRCSELLSEVERLSANKKRRSERAHEAWRTRLSNHPRSLSHRSPKGTLESPPAPARGTVGEGSIDNPALPTLQNPLLLPNITNQSNGVNEVNNLLRVIGQTLSQLSSSTPPVNVTAPPNPSAPVCTSAPSLMTGGRPTNLPKPVFNFPTTTGTKLLHTDFDLCSSLEQISEVNEHNVSDAIKAARRCIETFSSDIRRLENQLSKASTSADLKRIARSFQSIFRFHLFARLGNISIRMREEAPRTIVPPSGLLKPIPADSRSIYSCLSQPAPQSTNPISIDLTSDSEETHRSPSKTKRLDSAVSLPQDTVQSSTAVGISATAAPKFLSSVVGSAKESKHKGRTKEFERRLDRLPNPLYKKVKSDVPSPPASSYTTSYRSIIDPINPPLPKTLDHPDSSQSDATEPIDITTNPASEDVHAPTSPITNHLDSSHETAELTDQVRTEKPVDGRSHEGEDDVDWEIDVSNFAQTESGTPDPIKQSHEQTEDSNPPDQESDRPNGTCSNMQTLTDVPLSGSAVVLEDIRSYIGDKSVVRLKGRGLKLNDVNVEETTTERDEQKSISPGSTPSDAELRDLESEVNSLERKISNFDSKITKTSKRTQPDSHPMDDSSDESDEDTENEVSSTPAKRRRRNLPDKSVEGRDEQPRSRRRVVSKSDEDSLSIEEDRGNEDKTTLSPPDHGDSAMVPESSVPVEDCPTLRSALLSSAEAEFDRNLKSREQLLQTSSDDSVDGECNPPKVVKCPRGVSECAMKKNKIDDEEEVNTEAEETENSSEEGPRRCSYRGVKRSLMRRVWSSSDEDLSQHPTRKTRKTKKNNRPVPRNPQANDSDSANSSSDNKQSSSKHSENEARSDLDDSVYTFDEDSASSEPVGVLHRRKRRDRSCSSFEPKTDLDSFKIKPKRGPKKLLGKPDISDGSDTSAEPRKRRSKRSGVRRVRHIRTASADEQSEGKSETEGESGKEEETDNLNQSQNSDTATDDKKGRKHIRKILDSRRVSSTTKSAEAEEEERRRRIAERQKAYNEWILQENVGTEVVTKKLLLEKAENETEVVEVHEEILKHLKPHQVEAVRFLWDCVIESVERHKDPANSNRSCGAILAHCMGLGKTLSLIAFVHTLFRKPDLLGIRSCLILCPVNTLLNWKHEWEMWLPEDETVNVYELASKVENKFRIDLLKHWHEDGGVMILGYDMFRNFVTNPQARIRSKPRREAVLQALLEPGPDIVVCDEGHVLKNDKSGLSKAVSRIRTLKRIILTGTPLQNNLTEYHAMVNFVKPNLLGSAKEFHNRFANPIKNGQHSNSTPADVQLMKRRAHVLYKTLDGCVQRKDYHALTKYLPPRYEYVIMCRLSEVQCNLYRIYLKVRSDHPNREAQGQNTEDGPVRRESLFADQQTLYRIWTHPFLLRSHETRNARKMLLMHDDDDEEEFINDSGSSTEESSSDSNSNPDSEQAASSSNQNKPTRSTCRMVTRSRGNDQENAENEVTDLEADQDAPTESRSPHSDTPDPWWYEHYEEEYDWRVDVGTKLDVLLRILKKCSDIGDKVIVFTQSLLSLDLLERFLGELGRQWLVSQGKIADEQALSDTDTEAHSDGGNRETAAKRTKRSDLFEYFSDIGFNTWVRGKDYERMDGTMSAVVRKELQHRFNSTRNTRLRLFLISTRAGGLGINLVSANRLILFDACWNPSMDIQSIFRSYRFGQTKPVYIYRLIAQGTMEEKIYDRQITKESLALRVVDEQQIDRHFSTADLQALFTFEPDVWDPIEAGNRPTPKLPKDHLLADMLSEYPNLIVSYHDHDSLLEHRADEGLTEEQRQEAWREYEEEKRLGISLAQHQRLMQQQLVFAQQQQQLKAFREQQQAEFNARPHLFPRQRFNYPYPFAPQQPGPTMAPPTMPFIPVPHDQFTNVESPYTELYNNIRTRILTSNPQLGVNAAQLERMVMDELVKILLDRASHPFPAPQPVPSGSGYMMGQPRPSV
ncbi:unnamed protein product [Calicophoron daubneyi]|uniref:ATP-dependent helicase ATRX n=1 Tax=Calicophoron daubneyi TaxID=300641 RepID=A0AAV2SZE5_CALDB